MYTTSCALVLFQKKILSALEVVPWSKHGDYLAISNQLLNS